MMMPDQTITITVGGDVLLSYFADTLDRLNALLNALGDQVGAEAVEWVIDELAVGSAVATIRGIGEDTEGIARATAAFATVGVALERNAPIPFSPSVVNAARELTQVINGKAPFLILAAGDKEATITESSVASSRQPTRVTALGSLTGVVQTLSQYPGYRFIVSDETSGRSVPCRFRADQTEDMRAIWGKRAMVEGVITRDRESGHPVSVTEVDRVTLARDVPKGAFLRARGVVRAPDGGESPSATIRRMRDAS